MSVVRLFSSSLLSKWGFNDGDAPDGWLDWVEQEGLDWRLGGYWRDGVLPELVRRYLIPRIEQEVAVVVMATNHNPVRAETVDGTDVADWWTGTGASGHEPKLTPEYVEIPYEDVLEVARAMRQAEPGKP